MRRRVSLGLGVGVGAGLMLASASASAHLASTGFGPVYDGITHLFVSVDDLMPVLAVALLAGLNGPAAGRRVLAVLPVAWLVGGVAGLHGAATGLPAGITALSLLLMGILVATDRRLGGCVIAVLAAALGLLHGALNGAGVAAAGREAVGLLGIAGAVVVLTALVAGGVLALRQPWTRLAVRVAGSWVAATGLLLAGWTLSGRM